MSPTRGYSLEDMRKSTVWVAEDDPERQPLKTGEAFERELEKTKKREKEINDERTKPAVAIQARPISCKLGSVQDNK